MNRSQHWERIRKRGMLRFVLLRGVVGWGVLTAVTYTLVMHFFYPPFPWSMFLECLWQACQFGVVLGLALWYFAQWAHRRDE